MTNLDSLEEVEKLDKSKVLSSIRNLDKQIEQSWQEIKDLEVPENCSIAKNVVICGMGGSALGGRVLDSINLFRARVPIEVFTEFSIPNYVSADTLVILSSYSGNTEETLIAGNEALNRNAKIFGITTGGKLSEFLKNNNLSGYIFNPVNNPSNQPRMALGYSIAAIAGVLARCGFITIMDSDIEKVLVTCKRFISEFDVVQPETSNLAKSSARRLLNKIPILIASEHLIGVTHSFKNQLNENSKTFSALFDIPELNHHLMEGLKFPKLAKTLIHFLLFESKLYSERIIERYPITRQVIEKNGDESSVYVASSESKLQQVFEILVFGSYVSYYLALLNGIDPAPIPWVDYFKQKLSEK